MFLVMLLTYTIGNISMKVHAATESINTTKGEPTKIYASAFVQNTDDWNWMSIGDNSNLVYQDVTNFKANNTNNVFAKSNSTANFGINIVDGNLAEGDSNILKFHIGTVTVKADGYDDLIINLNKDYSESLLGLKASWGLTGNGKQILLNDYLQKDATARTNYLHKITGITADITLSEYKYIKAVPQEPEFPADYKHPTTMRGLSAMDLVKDMKVGWNLGNTLEAAGGETGWGNPKTTKKMIDEIKKAGFSTVRIPVRWDENYTDANYTIDPAYMARVETVVNYVLANDMYAIINIHHNKIQGEMDEANKASVINEGSIVWTQIGERFKDYSDKLIFDTINEPRHEEDWVGTEEYYNVVNKYNAKILSAMRATGGNNEKRLVIMPTYCAAADYSKISAMVVPKDDNVAVSIHAYLPYDFALNAAAGSQATFGDADKVYLDKVFRLINKTFVEKGIPVVMDEFAATDKNNLEDRINFTKYYTQLAGTYGIPCCWWDNGNSGISSINNTMTLFNRKTLTFIYPEIIKALFDGWSNPKDVSKYDENMLFNGTATSSNWGQALSFYYGLDFVDADFSNKLAIAVEYTSEKAPQLVLSGNLTGVNWVTVTPAITKSDGTTNIAYFTLNDMVSAYKKALSSYDSYGRILPGLQTISVGDQGANLTVRKVYKIYVQKLEEKVSDATINEANKKLYVDSATENTATLSVTLPTELQKVVDNGLLNCKISYKTSDDKVVNVSQDGKITATGIGTTTITTTVILGDSTKSFTTTIEVKSSSAPLLGDVNADGEVDILDYIALQKYIVDPSTTITTTNANLNGDSKINTADLLALRKIILNS
jgi:aryl-phospho-beta-D-glucosidase BglC (GH1 family)